MHFIYLGNAEEIELLITETTRMGIPVLRPDINQSLNDFTPYVPDNNRHIRFGLWVTKSIGNVAATNIMS
jgi:DNA polymerase-3 subunit alpha